MGLGSETSSMVGDDKGEAVRPGLGQQEVRTGDMVADEGGDGVPMKAAPWVRSDCSQGVPWCSMT